MERKRFDRAKHLELLYDEIAGVKLEYILDLAEQVYNLNQFAVSRLEDQHNRIEGFEKWKTKMSRTARTPLPETPKPPSGIDSSGTPTETDTGPTSSP